MQPGWDEDLKRQEKQDGRRLVESLQGRLRTAALMAVGEVGHVRTLGKKVRPGLLLSGVVFFCRVFLVVKPTVGI